MAGAVRNLWLAIAAALVGRFAEGRFATDDSLADVNLDVWLADTPDGWVRKRPGSGSSIISTSLPSFECC